MRQALSLPLTNGLACVWEKRQALALRHKIARKAVILLKILVRLCLYVCLSNRRAFHTALRYKARADQVLDSQFRAPPLLIERLLW